MLSEHYLCKVITVKGPSMLPTVNGKTDLLFLDAFTSHFVRNPRKGEVILATNPFKQGHNVVKRVKFVEDEVASFEDPRDGRVHQVRIPKGHVWVEGDNPDQSKDSRDYGPMSLQLCQGIIRGKVWPLKSFGRFND